MVDRSPPAPRLGQAAQNRALRDAPKEGVSTDDDKVHPMRRVLTWAGESGIGTVFLKNSLEAL